MCLLPDPKKKFILLVEQGRRTMQEERIIHLNIGGRRFSTSKETLLRDPNCMLAAMFSGRHRCDKQPDGTYFIDRDGTYFSYILNYLRDGEVDLPDDQQACKALLREARFYNLSSLERAVESKLNSQKELFTAVEIVRDSESEKWKVIEIVERTVNEWNVRSNLLILMRKIVTDYNEKGYTLQHVLRTDEHSEDWRTTLMFSKRVDKDPFSDFVPRSEWS